MLNKGLPEAVCARASEEALVDPLYVSLMAQVVRRLPFQRLSVQASPFIRASLAWIGASLFASIPVSLCKYLIFAIDHWNLFILIDSFEFVILVDGKLSGIHRILLCIE